MASPFRVFRKYQKTLLVIAGVVLMFVFVVGDALVGYLGGGPSVAPGTNGALAPNAVAVRWDGGSLTNMQLDQLVTRRRLVNAFVQGVEATGRERALMAGVEPRPLRVDMIVGPELPQQGVEGSVVQTKLFADLARKAGMEVSDAAIVRYLDELGRQHVTRDEMRQMIHQMQVGGSRANTEFIFGALREELLARNYLASYQFSFYTITPEQNWEDWLRLNDRVVVEAAAIPVASSLVDVPEPTDAELMAFLEPADQPGFSYLKREPQPDRLGGLELPSRFPGFAIPRRIDVQYIKANYDDFLTKVENEVTDEEIEKYYEANKDPLFIQADMTSVDELSAPNSTSTEAPATNDTSEEGTATDSSPTSETTGSESESEGTTPSQPDNTAPAAGESPTNSTESDAAEGKQSRDGQTTRRSPYRLAAFLQEEQPGEDATAITGTDQSATDTTLETPPASEAAATSDETTADSSATPPVAEAAPKVFQPLDEVRDQIREQIAREKVTEQLMELMSKLESQLDGAFTKYFASSISADADEQELPPPPPILADLAPLAQEHGLEHGKTGPLSALEMRDTPVGGSFDREAGLALFQILFGTKDLGLYQPVATVDLDGNRYLSMMTSDTPARVPNLDEVRAEVVQAWKKSKAAEIALKRAQEDAKKAAESGVPLSEFFAEDPSVKIVTTDPFSWWTGGAVSRITGEQQPFRLGEPDGIEAAGPSFMREVFSLGEGEVGAALNNDHSTAYVIRVTDHQLSQEELRAAYMSEAMNWPGMQGMNRDHAQFAARTLLNEVRLAANVEWERPADQLPEND